MTAYILHLAILAGIYVILAQSLSLLVGHLGLLSLSQGAFFGLGAYLTAGLPMIGLQDSAISLLAAAAGGWLFAWILAIPLTRLSEDYFVIASLGAQVILVSMLRNLTFLTKGPLGIDGIERGQWLGFQITNDTTLLGVVVLTTTAISWLLHRLTKAPTGLVLRAIRDDELFAESIGYDAAAVKRKVFCTAAAGAAAAGSLYARHMTFIEPGIFDVSESIVILTMVILGGLGSLRGATIGALLLVALPELLRGIGISASSVASLRHAGYGLIILLCLLIWPRGLMGEVTLGELHPRRLR